jgi:hypothetical protein
MPRTTPESRSAQARLAVVTREHGPVAAPTVAAREHWRSEKYLAAVQAAVAAAPPLSADQRDRLSRILAPVVKVVSLPTGNAA